LLNRLGAVAHGMSTNGKTRGSDNKTVSSRRHRLIPISPFSRYLAGKFRTPSRMQAGGAAHQVQPCARLQGVTGGQRHLSPIENIVQEV